MGSMKRLLDTPLRVFTLYALIVLACSIPAYYFLVNYFWIKELDEHNERIAETTEESLNTLQQDPMALEQSIVLWNQLQPDLKITPLDAETPDEDKVYTVEREHYDADEEELAVDQFRGLRTVIEVGEGEYQLVVETNVEEMDQTMGALTLITIGFFAVLLVGFILLNRWLSIRLWRPFQATLQKLQAFDLNSGHPLHFERTDIQEFSELNLVLDRLIAQNLAVYKAQKEFTENASHELQTPLAIIKSKLDLLVQSESLNEEAYETIEAIQTALTRVSRTNRNLLLLAKLENRQFADQTSLNLTTILEHTIETLSPYLENKNLSLQKDIQPQVHLQGNEILLEILLNNLLLNAIRHSPSGTTLRIHLYPSEFSISNPGTIPLNTATLFQRFASTSQEKPGTGLGLAIVKQICIRSNWRLDYAFQEKAHVFTVRF